MPICAICGENKKMDQFLYIKRFKTFKNRDVEWCQDCQKMWIDMKQEELKEKKFSDKVKNFSGLVEFK